MLLVDKPYGWTSFQAVAKIRATLQRQLGMKKLKVGHAGTLDPLATGLLILCVGKKTKEIQDFMGLDKEYVADIQLGATTPSYDLETEIDQRFSTEGIDEHKIIEALGGFLGEIDQMPPVFSAVKKEGVRAYEKARAGEEVTLKARRITIHELELLHFEDDIATVRVRCGKGTYIRSLAHDLGQVLGCGGFLSDLRRTKIGPYAAQGAKDPKEWSVWLRENVRVAD